MLILLCYYFWPGHIFSAWMLICNKYFFLKCLFSTGMLIFNKKAYFYPKCLFSTGELLILTHKCKFSWQENAFWTRYILYSTVLHRFELGVKKFKNCANFGFPITSQNAAFPGESLWVSSLKSMIEWKNDRLAVTNPLIPIS